MQAHRQHTPSVKGSCGSDTIWQSLLLLSFFANMQSDMNRAKAMHNMLPMTLRSIRPASPRRRNGRSAGDNGDTASPHGRVNGDYARPFEVQAVVSHSLQLACAARPVSCLCSCNTVKDESIGAACQRRLSLTTRNPLYRQGEPPLRGGFAPWPPSCLLKIFAIICLYGCV